MRVELEKARLRRGDREVLEVPHLVLPPAAIVAVVGDNGSGKTTLLETLALLRRPAEGVVRIDGEDVFASPSHLRRRRLEVTLVLQEPYLFSGTVRSNVELPLRIRRVPRRERRRRALAALETLDAASLADRHAQELSAGERQRVAIARGIVAEPRLLLLDEPFAHLDPSGADRVQEWIRRTPSSGRGLVVFSSPPRSVPEATCDFRFDLRAGRIVSCADESTALSDPKHSIAR